MLNQTPQPLIMQGLAFRCPECDGPVCVTKTLQSVGWRPDRLAPCEHRLAIDPRTPVGLLAHAVDVEVMVESSGDYDAAALKRAVAAAAWRKQREAQGTGAAAFQGSVWRQPTHRAASFKHGTVPKTRGFASPTEAAEVMRERLRYTRTATGWEDCDAYFDIRDNDE